MPAAPLAPATCSCSSRCIQVSSPCQQLGGGAARHMQWSPARTSGILSTTPLLLLLYRQHQHAQKRPPTLLQTHLDGSLTERLNQTLAALPHRKDVGRLNPALGVHPCRGKGRRHPSIFFVSSIKQAFAGAGWSPGHGGGKRCWCM